MELLAFTMHRRCRGATSSACSGSAGAGGIRDASRTRLHCLWSGPELRLSCGLLFRATELWARLGFGLHMEAHRVQVAHGGEGVGAALHDLPGLQGDGAVGEQGAVQGQGLVLPALPADVAAVLPAGEAQCRAVQLPVSRRAACQSGQTAFAYSLQYDDVRCKGLHSTR